MLAWNASLPHGRERENFLNPYIGKMEFCLQKGFRALLENLMSAMQMLYAHVTRMIIDFEITRLPDGILTSKSVRLFEVPDIACDLQLYSVQECRMAPE